MGSRYSVVDMLIKILGGNDMRLKAWHPGALNLWPSGLRAFLAYQRSTTMIGNSTRGIVASLHHLPQSYRASFQLV